ncbi:MAG: PAS domain S-box protein [Chloroflexi bacterium]|nr:PAS domain S-box protein [Chloroflexota bacterium]
MKRRAGLSRAHARRAHNPTSHLALTLHSIGDGIITTDTAERITFANTAAEQLTGWTATDAIGAHLLDVFRIVNSKTREPASDPAANALATGAITGLSADTALVARDGVERLISSSVAPIRNRAGKITGAVLVFRDITRLRRAEEALKESQEYNRSLIDSSLDMIIAVDQHRRIIEFNRAAQDIFGYAPEEILGADVRVLYANPDDGAQIQQAIAEKGRVSQEVWNRRKNGHVFPALLSASQLRNAQGDIIGVMGVSRDITALKQAAEQHIKAERLAALGQMAAALAHEINNPLQAISSTMDLVLDFNLDAAEREENLRIVRQEIERLSLVAGRILRFARPAASPRRLVAVTDLLNETLTLARKQMQQANVRVRTDLYPLPRIVASPEQLIQVFLNLALNATEASKEGGELSITASAEADTIVITFDNDGPHIPPDILPHVFEPFFTTKENGSGLGLPVSQSIVQQHGGTLTVENLGATQGVRFTVRLPLVWAHAKNQ